MNSPCDECRHCVSELVTTDAWAGNQYEMYCEEGAPYNEGPYPLFMSEWGCFRYEERPELD